ncbi:integrase catalytic domain-containing protein [Trichonephila clavipes]|nr:integrase catalytic domain-containing protein [Trichonephila clavipes]
MQLISKFEELSTLDKEIENLIDIESLEEEIVTREEYRDKFIIWKIRAERYVESVSNTAIQNSVENQPQNITLPLNSTVSSILTNQPRLPKLTLESFSGKDISSFPSFWARFKSAVHENSSLNDVDKFSYLKSVVTSDAELAIRGLTLTSENYAKAMKILENRFGRKELIVDFHMNRLLNLTPVRKSFDVIALRNLYDHEVESRERTEILVKPHDLELKNKNSYSNTKYFERTSHSYPQSNRRVQGHSRFHPSHKSFSSANELLTAAFSNCLFCFENTHMSDLCENLCVQKKRAKLIKEGRCFICCNTGCYVKKCKKEVCSYCKGRHARAICFKLEKSKQNSHLDLEEKNVDVKTKSSNSVFHNRGGVLLQCVKAEIIGRSSSDKIFCIFDNGREKSFITKKNVSRRLGLKILVSERLNIFSFGCKTPKKQTCSKVEVRLRNVLSGEETVIGALEIEEISKATLSLPNPDAWADMESKGEEESISTELRRFWEIESLGILDKGSVTLGNGDEEILSEFDKSVNFVDGRYRVNLPWKPGMREALQNNKTVARKRFEGLVRRFKCDHELFCEYKDVIDDYVRESIFERTSCDSLLDSQGFYLPHHAVIRSDKTTSPIRIVFDGSAHENGQSSLNQSLYTGPNLHPNILELLLCFRKSPVAFTADVKSAFLQIELDFRDRDFTRFFWTDNLNNEPYVLNFTRVLFGLRPSPYLLAATLKHHFKKYREQYPHTFELLNSSIYVDDLICGQNDVPDALRTTLECLQIFSDAGMLLRKWRSNSKQLNLLWQQEGVKTESSETSAIDLRPPTKVLGLAWDPENDLIYFDPKDLLKFMSRRGESKRFILSVIGRIFDPIGILGPFVIKLKCLLQELWTLGVEWDSELPQSYDTNASKSAYGTILYLRFVTCNNEIETSFICSKSRVAPLKSLTLPRLELTAALLSARLAKQVSSCLKFDANIYYLTDSLISYYWIRGVSATLTQLRQKYWIPKSRQLVKTMIRICLVCKKYSAKPADQLSGQLPRDRITQSPPFQIVGIGFTGAILVKDNQGTRKSYVSLFTCAVTRAVHLELVSDMPQSVFYLLYGDSSLVEVIASEFQNFVADKGIHWKFIVERAPWWGEFYERLVKTIKDPLRKILGRALLTFEELSTILSEVEVIVNHRPLTYVENDPGEPEPLTPAHFLELGYGDSKYPIHFIELIDATTAKESYKKRKTYRTLFLKQLWRRWKEQYLL